MSEQLHFSPRRKNPDLAVFMTTWPRVQNFRVQIEAPCEQDGETESERSCCGSLAPLSYRKGPK